MENVVTMSLDQYTDLIKENILLKDKLEGLKRQARYNIQEYIKDSKIRTLDRTQTVSWLNETDPRKLLSEFSNNYSWEWDNIASRSYVLTTEDVKRMAAEEISSQLNSHLRDILDKEEAEDK